MIGPLHGRVILIVEDEPIIAFDLQSMLEDDGATTLTAVSLVEGMKAVEAPTISAAIIDHGLGGGDSSAICRRLTERGVPFVTYSGQRFETGACSFAEHFDKLTDPKNLLAALRKLTDQTTNAAAAHG